jgi:hypothetical protein
MAKGCLLRAQDISKSQNERSSFFAPILGNGDLNANEKEKYINTDILKMC